MQEKGHKKDKEIEKENVFLIKGSWEFSHGGEMK